ncbi:MAG: type II secretion system protein GspM [Sphingomonas sp.]
MSERVKRWLDGRSLREKRMLLAMVTAIALSLFWFALILPVVDGLASAKERENSAALLLAQTETRVDAIKASMRNRPAALGGPLDAVIRARADIAGFALGSVTAQSGDRVQISIGSARPGALVSWLGELEDDGILVDTLNLSDNGDKTVSAQISLRARGL